MEHIVFLEQLRLFFPVMFFFSHMTYTFKARPKERIRSVSLTIIRLA